MKRQYTSMTLMVLAGVLNAFGVVLNVPETWSTNNVSGWVRYDDSGPSFANNLTVESNALKMTCSEAADSVPPTTDYAFYAGTNASGSRFTGNYVKQGVTDIQFRLFCQAPVDDDGVSLILWGANEVWRCWIPGIHTGVWTNVSVSVAIPDMANDNLTNEWALFETSLRDVKAVGVEIVRTPDGKTVSYKIDDFELKGVGADYATWMEPFTNHAGYGTGDISVMSGADLDGDGEPNLHEWIAGTSAGDANDRFRVHIEQSATKQPRLRWTAVAGRKYQVLSAENLSEPFSPMGSMVDAPTNTYDIPVTNGNMKGFFKITVEKP